ncbi:proprotein convertase P-domain-containing protein [Streptomyces sp. NPDC093595]|uniref:proprotein convertase P-domain-containing protein n=1 Tax=Streptomyces sp. NPDC093595 TaxID=3366045 RepID=UPI00382184EB
MFIQLGDSFGVGEGAGWKGNTNQSAGDRLGTDVAARYHSDLPGWTYHPETYVYQSNTYRELDGHWGTNPCHRAYQSPISYVKGWGDQVLNLACSGAQSKHIWPASAGGVEQHPGLKTQLDQLKDAVSASSDVAMVAVSVGGNDIDIPAFDKPGFGELVVKCIESFVHTHYPDGFDPQYCNDEIAAGVGDAVSDVFYNQLKTIDLVRQTLAAEGHPIGSYKLVLTGYPSITPTDESDWFGAEGDGWANHCPIRKADSRYINTHVVSRLNDVIQAAAEEKGVGFINMEEAFDGHRLCEAGTVRTASAAHPESAEWVRFLDVDDTINPLWEGIKSLLFGDSPDEWKSQQLRSQRSIAESFHPNSYGQKALGYCLRTYYNDDLDNSLQRCHIAGTGSSSTPDNMVTSTRAALYKATDDPADSVTIGYPLTRTLTVPSSVPAGHYFQWLPKITHPSKGQLKITLQAPDGTTFMLRDFNFEDTGDFGNGTHTSNYTGDPSGTWTLRIWDGISSHDEGTLDKWSLKLF